MGFSIKFGLQDDFRSKPDPSMATPVAQLPLLAALARKREGRSQEKEGKDALKGIKSTETKEVQRKPRAKAKAKKGAPQEVSSSRPVAPPVASASRVGAKVASMRARDPRFDDTSGSFDMDGFSKAYAFLEEYREDEMKKLQEAKNSLQKRKKKKLQDPELIEAENTLNREIKHRIQQDKQRKHLGQLRAAEKSLKSQEREKVKTTGKVPFFMAEGKHGSSWLRERRIKRVPRCGTRLRSGVHKSGLQRRRRNFQQDVPKTERKM